MLEKVMQRNIEIIKNETEKETGNHQKTIKTKSKRLLENKHTAPEVRLPWRRPVLSKTGGPGCPIY